MTSTRLKKGLWDQIRTQAGERATRQEKQQGRERRKETCSYENRKRNKRENGVKRGGCVIFLMASTETGNGAVTHRK